MEQKIRTIIAGCRNFNIIEIVEMVMLNRFDNDYSEIELVGGGLSARNKYQETR